MGKPSRTVNLVLAEEHALKLQRLTEQTRLIAGTLARSLLSRALDQA